MPSGAHLVVVKVMNHDRGITFRYVDPETRDPFRWSKRAGDVTLTVEWLTIHATLLPRNP